MTSTDWAIVGATIIGPILAVQAQKVVEAFSNRRREKIQIFRTLMATRLAKLSPDHVQALNLIDVIFNSPYYWKSKTERSVIDAWKAYHDHLTNSSESAEIWNAKYDELFNELLFSISNDLGYHFDKTHIRRTAYSPQHYRAIELENEKIRKLITQVLSGELPLKMNIESIPVDEDLLKAQRELNEKIASAYTAGALVVKVKAEPRESL